MIRSILIGAAIFAGIAAPASADDALKGKWSGTDGTSSIILIIENVKGGILTGSISSQAFRYPLSGAKPSDKNAQAKYDGAAITITLPAGAYALELQSNALKGRYLPKSARGRPRDVSLTRQ